MVINGHLYHNNHMHKVEYLFSHDYCTYDDGIFYAIEEWKFYALIRDKYDIDYGQYVIVVDHITNEQVIYCKDIDELLKAIPLELVDIVKQELESVKQI